MVNVSYGMNPQASLMFPFDREISEVLSVCHGGGVRRADGFSSYNQQCWRDVSPTVRLPLGADNYAKVLIWR